MFKQIASDVAGAVGSAVGTVIGVVVGIGVGAATGAAVGFVAGDTAGRDLVERFMPSEKVIEAEVVIEQPAKRSRAKAQPA
jgi:outer membrane lipoprotein SlyB